MKHTFELSERTAAGFGSFGAVGKKEGEMDCASISPTFKENIP